MTDTKNCTCPWFMGRPEQFMRCPVHGIGIPAPITECTCPPDQALGTMLHVLIDKDCPIHGKNCTCRWNTISSGAHITGCPSLSVPPVTEGVKENARCLEYHKDGIYHEPCFLKTSFQGNHEESKVEVRATSEALPPLNTSQEDNTREASIEHNIFVTLFARYLEYDDAKAAALSIMRSIKPLLTESLQEKSEAEPASSEVRSQEGWEDEAEYIMRHNSEMGVQYSSSRYANQITELVIKAFIRDLLKK